MKIKAGFDNVIHKVRTISFYIANELGGRDFWRKGYCDMHMVGDPADRMNESLHVLNLCRDSSVKLWLKNRIN